MRRNVFQCNIVSRVCVCVCVSGLIIDAFGELRDQQEQVKEDMEVRSFL